ncbi:DinB family protein [bacterium]|nr:MAG: DinB family protein [bacterium]
MKWTELLTTAVNENYKVTDALMVMVDDDSLDWKPATGTNWMTTGQLLMHLTGSCGACFKGFVTGDWGMPEGMEMGDGPDDHESMLPPAEALPTVESVAKARELLAADKQVALDMLAQAGEDDLDQKKLAAPWDPNREIRLGEHLLGMVIHLQSHKSQLFYYLKLRGQEVNTLHLWGM